MQTKLLQSLPPSKTIWVGFSGGLDSSVLLHALKTQYPINIDLRAIHVHHGLQKQADDWATHCQKICEQWQVPLEIVRIDISESHRNTEHKARQARYAVFQKILPAGATLALAHHQDDVVETLFLRLLRGSGTQALANMQPQSQRDQYHIWRPFLHCSRADLEQYAEQHHLQWIEDDSNSDTRFDRNFIRHEILPKLEQRFTNAKQAIAQSADLLAADATLLKPHIESAFAHCLIGNELCISKLLMLNTSMQAHVFRAWLHQQSRATPTARALAEFLQQLQQHQSDDSITLEYADYRICAWRDALYAVPKTMAVHTDATTAIFWDGLKPLVLPRGGTLQWLGKQAIPLHIKYRIGGETIQLKDQKIHHQVKKLLSQSVPPWQRDSLPFVYNEQGELLAVGNCCISEILHQFNLQHACTLQWSLTNEPKS